MEIAKVITARAIRLFDVEELNPDGLHWPPIILEVGKRYRVQSGLEKPQDFDIQKGFSLTGGVFDGRPVLLKVYHNGLVAESSANTSHAESFLEDVISFVGQLGARNETYILKQKKAYRSEIVVFSPTLRLEAFQPPGSLLADLSEVFGKNLKPFGLTFGDDSGSSDLVLERRSGLDFDQHKYFSSATLTTEKHLEALALIENLTRA